MGKGGGGGPPTSSWGKKGGVKSLLIRSRKWKRMRLREQEMLSWERPGDRLPREHRPIAAVFRTLSNRGSSRVEASNKF